MQNFLFLFASTYGEGAYGECLYAEGCSPSDGGTSAGGSGLADTGIWIVAIATLACLLIFVALLARWLASRNAKKPNSVAASLNKSSNSAHSRKKNL